MQELLGHNDVRTTMIYTLSLRHPCTSELISPDDIDDTCRYTLFIQQIELVLCDCMRLLMQIILHPQTMSGNEEWT